MKQDTINNFTCIFTFVLLLIPIGVVWLALYLRLKKYIKTALNYCVLILFSIILIDLYFLLTGYIAFELAGESIIAELVGMVSYVVVLCIGWPGIIMIFLTLILTILYFINKQKKKKQADT